MRFRRTPEQLDRVLAVALFVGAELQVALAPAHGWALASEALVAGLVTGSVAVRRRYPSTVGIVVQGLLAAEGLVAQLPAGCVTAAWFCALYALAVWTTWPRFTVGVLFFVASNLLPSLGDLAELSRIWDFTAVVVLVMVFLRIIVGRRDRQLRVAERERDLARREAVVEERARIARELHDAIAHHVSMMVVQAGAERRVLDGKGGTTREVLETIERIGRGALTEMRRLVGMLRSDAGEPLAPQPGLDDLPTLVGQVCEAGLPVELHVDGERRELPVGIELSAYRIVQEALTNALKHAGESHASVRVHYGADSLELEIVDDGGGAAVPVSSGGDGLGGGRGRVAPYRGPLPAAPPPPRGVPRSRAVPRPWPPPP